MPVFPFAAAREPEKLAGCVLSGWKMSCYIELVNESCDND